ncbi:MAG: hypothetical protein R3C45_08510 [Phycisphaerales bacterium]
MKLLLGILVWLVVFAFFPLIAIAALILWPVIWLISLPVRLLLMVIDAAMQLVKAVLLLPSRILGFWGVRQCA